MKNKGNELVQDMWKDFCTKNHIDINAEYDSWHFCDTKELADKLIELVLSGKKRGTAGLKFEYEHDNEYIPKVGEYNVLTDFDGNPKCIMQIEKI